MTDQAIPADKVRDLLAIYSDTPGDFTGLYSNLEALLPPLPTLADMAPEELPACQWAQADVEGRNTRYVIANPDGGDGEATLIDSDGGDRLGIS